MCVCVCVCVCLGSITSAVPRVSCEGTASASEMQFYSSSYSSGDRPACEILSKAININESKATSTVDDWSGEGL